jgi:hypothetical protein
LGIRNGAPGQCQQKEADNAEPILKSIHVVLHRSLRSDAWLGGCAADRGNEFPVAASIRILDHFGVIAKASRVVISHQNACPRWIDIVKK